MLLKLSENIEKTLPLRRVYKGVVVDNVDPDKLGRLKVTIEGLFTGDTANLPWVFPLRNDTLGGKADSGFYSVPEIGSYLEIRFPTEDVYTPFYYGYWEDPNTHVAEFDTDYPDTYGFKDRNGTKFVVNKKQETLEILHVSGIRIFFSKEGDYTMDVPKSFTGNVMDVASLTVEKALTITGNDEINVSAVAKAIFKGTAGTDLGDNSSVTNVFGRQVLLAGGGPAVARVGDIAVGTGNLGAPVVSNIVQGSGKVFSG